jgi:hypothetical protein
MPIDVGKQPVVEVASATPAHINNLRNFFIPHPPSAK